jgi:signal transduction histidine kinase
MAKESMKRVDTLAPDANQRERGGEEGPASDLWPLSRRPSYQHMSQVACDARNLLAALGANVDWLKSVLTERPPLEDLADGLHDIETCCERLRDLVEEALIGSRKEGLSASRAMVSMESIVAVCLRQVKRRATARQVGFEIVGGELYAMLDGPLLMRAMIRLLDRAVMQVEIGATLQIQYALVNDEISIAVARLGPGLRSAPSGSHRSPSVHPASHCETLPHATEQGNAEDLEFVHLAAEAHGGKLLCGGSSLYRICLPWGEANVRR